MNIHTQIPPNTDADLAEAIETDTAPFVALSCTQDDRDQVEDLLCLLMNLETSAVEAQRALQRLWPLPLCVHSGKVGDRPSVQSVSSVVDSTLPPGINELEAQLKEANARIDRQYDQLVAGAAESSQLASANGELLNQLNDKDRQITELQSRLTNVAADRDRLARSEERLRSKHAHVMAVPGVRELVVGHNHTVTAVPPRISPTPGSGGDVADEGISFPDSAPAGGESASPQPRLTASITEALYSGAMSVEAITNVLRKRWPTTLTVSAVQATLIAHSRTFRRTEADTWMLAAEGKREETAPCPA